MSDYETAIEPEWDSPISLQTTPRAIIECVFWNADAVHTGYESCIDPKLVTGDTVAHEDNGDNYCRYVEQEYMEDEAPEDTTWHDWAVELKLGETFVVAHWRVQVGGSPSDWDWCERESEKAFTVASVLVGKRVRKCIAVDTSSYGPRPSRTHH